MSTKANKKKVVEKPTNVSPMPTGAAGAAAVNPAPGATTPAVAKKKRTKVQIPLTPAQIAAKEAMAKADAEAREQVIAQSAEKIAGAEQALAAAEKIVAEQRAALKALRKAVGISGTGGSKKIGKYIYLQDFPDKKGAPQARAILEIIKAAGKDGISRDKVVETMKTAITTDTDRSRLLSFYSPKLIEAGVVKGERAIPTVTAPATVATTEAAK